MLSDLDLTVNRIEQASPIITGFLLGYVVAMPLLGAYSDQRGRIPVYAACLGTFAAGSLITASAGLISLPSLPWLVAGRVLQGLGGGGLVPLTLALAADLYQAGMRAPAVGLVSALQESGSVLGPLYGAAVATAAAGLGGWRFVFAVNLPLAALCGAGIYLSARRTGVTGIGSGRRAVDWVGAALLGLGLALLVVALYPDEPTVRATNAYAVPAAIGAVAALGVFGWRQLRRLEPLIPAPLLKGRAFIGSNAANFAGGVALMVALADVPVVGRAIFDLDQLRAGLLLTQFLIGIPIGALAGGWLTGRLGPRLVAGTGFASAAAAFGLMARWRADELSHHVGFLRDADLVLGLCGLGFGLVIAPLAAAVLDAAGESEHGLASSLVILSRTMGMLLGLAALTAFGLRRFYQLLGPTPPVDPSQSLTAQLAAIQARVVAALLEEYREIFLIAAVICVLAGTIAVVTVGGRKAAARPVTLRP
jgi:MFS family permease